MDEIIDYINNNICAVGIKQEAELRELLSKNFGSDLDKKQKKTIYATTKVLMAYLMMNGAPEYVTGYFNNVFQKIEKDLCL